MRALQDRQLAPLRLHGFRLLFLSTLDSSVGTLLAAVALAIDVEQRTQSGLWVGGLLVVEFLPTILVGLTLGPLLDRLQRRRLMVGADLVRAAVFCALPFAAHAGTIVVLAAVAGLASGFFRPAVYAGVPNLVPASELAQANALLQGMENVSWAAGPIAGGLLTAAAGPHAAYWVNAASFLLSAALVSRIPARLLQSATALSRGHWGDLVDGYLTVRRSGILVAVLVAWSIAELGIGGVNVSEIFLAKDTFGAGDFGYGLLYGAIGTGLVLGSFGGGWFERRLGMAQAYGSSMGLIAVGFAAAAVSPDVWVAAACCVVAGVGNGAAGVCNALLVQRGARDEVRGRALTLVMSVNFVSTGIGTAVAGAALGFASPRWLWGGSAGAFAVAAAVGFALTRRAPASVLAGRAPLEPAA